MLAMSGFLTVCDLTPGARVEVLSSHFNYQWVAAEVLQLLPDWPRPPTDAGEQLASARSADASRPRNLRDLESSFKPKHSATPPRSPASLTASPKPLRAITPPPGGSRDRGEPRVEKAVSELIEKDKAREGDVQRMLEMVANLQSEMASLKRENGRRDAGPRPPPGEAGSRIPELS